MRIVHMTSVHPWHDTRIFVRMCRSLARAGHEVHLVVPRAEGPEEEVRDGVRIHAVPRPGNRLTRIFRTVKRVLKTAEAIQGDVYHFHDPEFLRVALRFQRRTGRPVVYDAHEDVRLQVLYKRWLHFKSRALTSRLVGRMEDKVSGRLAGVVAATPSIAERFSGHPHCVVVQNFPLVGELAPEDVPRGGAIPGRFAYVGGISAVRGTREMIAALPQAGPDVRLALAGNWAGRHLREECRALAGWPQVEELGFLERRGVRRLLASAQAGLVLFHPLPNHVKAHPNKMFEYMSADLPVIASDFPLWRSIIGEAECGLLVDPLDPKAIAGAMRWIMEHPDEAAAMGERGRRAVIERYNWERELAKLLELYAAIAG